MLELTATLRKNDSELATFLNEVESELYSIEQDIEANDGELPYYDKRALEDYQQRLQRLCKRKISKHARQETRTYLHNITDLLKKYPLE